MNKSTENKADFLSIFTLLYLRADCFPIINPYLPIRRGAIISKPLIDPYNHMELLISERLHKYVYVEWRLDEHDNLSCADITSV